MSDIITYEQPLTELMRAVLRIEYLFQQVDRVRAEFSSPHHSRILMRLLVDLLNLLDRPDLKSKLSKEFNRLVQTFSHLQSAKGVSQQTLREAIQQLKHMMVGYLDTRGKIAETLRMNGFLSSIKQGLLYAGGDSPTDAPRYWLWLHQPLPVQRDQFNQWFEQFSDIRGAIKLLLSIVRSSAEPRQLLAEKGFYHQALDPQSSLHVLRVGIAQELNGYPEISAGRHRVTVRFMTSDGVDSRSRQIMNDVPFLFTLCMI